MRLLKGRQKVLQFGEKIIVLDGAMGTRLEELGLAERPEDANMTDAEAIKSIHREYSAADIILTNTFGLNKIKYKGKFGIREVALKAIENARAAGKAVFFDVGPCLTHASRM